MPLPGQMVQFSGLFEELYCNQPLFIPDASALTGERLLPDIDHLHDKLKAARRSIQFLR